jgi:hypothetical protein
MKLTIPHKVPELGPTLALLHDHARRFRVLRVNATRPDIMDTILLSISEGNPTSLLEKLKFVIEPEEGIYDDEPEEPMPLDPRQPFLEHAFYPAPRLWKLALSALRLPLPSSKLLSTVTSLTITARAGDDDEQPSVERMLDIIEATPHLESLKYYGCDLYSHQPTYTLNFPSS